MGRPMTQDFCKKNDILCCKNGILPVWLRWANFPSVITDSASVVAHSMQDVA